MRKKGRTWVKEEGILKSVAVAALEEKRTDRGSDVSCEVVWLLVAASFYGAEVDDGNNPSTDAVGSVLVTYSAEGAAGLDALFVTARVAPLCLQGVMECSSFNMSVTYGLGYLKLWLWRSK